MVGLLGIPERRLFNEKEQKRSCNHGSGVRPHSPHNTPFDWFQDCLHSKHSTAVVAQVDTLLFAPNGRTVRLRK
jgi:hypothetical protein